MKHALLLIVLSVFVSENLSSADFRMDLVGQDGTGIAVRSCSEGTCAAKAAWLREKQDTRWLISGKASSEWKEHFFTFQAKRDGRIVLYLMGGIAQDGRKPFAAYDNFRAVGTVLNDPDFEEMSSTTSRFWNRSGNEARLIRENSAAGKQHIEVNHDNRFFQGIDCKAGETVTIRFAVRSAGG